MYINPQPIYKLVAKPSRYLYQYLPVFLFKFVHTCLSGLLGDATKNVLPYLQEIMRLKIGQRADSVFP